MTYRLTVHFTTRKGLPSLVPYLHNCPGCRRGRCTRVWTKGGYSLEAALDTKDNFLTMVPSAVYGEMVPEETR